MNQKNSEIEKFKQGLEKIENEQLPKLDDDSVLKKLTGIELSNKNQETINRFKNEQNKKIADYIICYQLADNYNDLVDFMNLVILKIKHFETLDGIIERAWISKMDEVYNKISCLSSDEDNLSKIQNLYNEATILIKKKKIKTLYSILIPLSFLFCLFLTMFCVIEGYVLELIVAAVLITVMFIVCYFIYTGINFIEYMKKLVKTDNFAIAVSLIFAIISFIVFLIVMH